MVDGPGGVPDVAWIRTRFAHHGEHSGYDMLCRAMSELGQIRAMSCWREAETDDSLPEFEERLVHVLYAENNLDLLHRKRPGRKLVATSHQPVDWWLRRAPAVVPNWDNSTAEDFSRILGGVDALIVVSRCELEYFKTRTNATVEYVPHGIDIEFFSPPGPRERRAKAARSVPICLTVGHWLRDFETLERVIEILAESPREVRHEFVVPDRVSDRHRAVLERLRRKPGVRLTAELSDRQLLRLYQEANLLLLPLIASTANNTVLEALSTGLPIVSNHTSGMSDYTNPHCAVVTEKGDAEAMASAVSEILSSPEAQLEMGSRARSLAVSEFSWPRVAADTLEVYRRVLRN